MENPEESPKAAQPLLLIGAIAAGLVVVLVIGIVVLG